MRRSVLFILIFTVLWIFIPMVGCSGEEPTLCECVGECACEGACSCGSADDDAYNGEGDVTEPDDEEREAWNPEILGKWRNTVSVTFYNELCIQRTLEWVELDIKDESTLCVNYGLYNHAGDFWADDGGTDKIIDERIEESTELYSYKMTPSSLKIYTLNTDSCITEFQYMIENDLIICERKSGENFPTFNIKEYGYTFIAPSIFAYSKDGKIDGSTLGLYTVENFDNPLIGTWNTHELSNYFGGSHYFSGIYQTRIVFESNNEVYYMPLDMSMSRGSISKVWTKYISQRYRYTFDDNILSIFNPDTFELVSEMKIMLYDDGTAAYFINIGGIYFPDVAYNKYQGVIYQRVK